LPYILFRSSFFFFSFVDFYHNLDRLSSMTLKNVLLKASLTSAACSFLFTGLNPAYAQEAVYVQIITTQLQTSVQGYRSATAQMSNGVNAAAAANQMFYLTQALDALNRMDQLAINNPGYCGMSRRFQNYAIEGGVIEVPTASHAAVEIYCAQYGR
jgi:hypothetical protein